MNEIIRKLSVSFGSLVALSFVLLFSGQSEPFTTGQVIATLALWISILILVYRWRRWIKGLSSSSMAHPPMPTIQTIVRGLQEVDSRMPLWLFLVVNISLILTCEMGTAVYYFGMVVLMITLTVSGYQFAKLRMARRGRS